MNNIPLQIAEERKKKLRLVKAAKKKLAAANAEIALTIPVFESIAKHRKDCVMFAPRQVTRLLQSVRRAVKTNYKRIKEAHIVLDAHETAKRRRRENEKEWQASMRDLRAKVKKWQAEGRLRS